jgi:hypothetical protein
MLSSDLEVLCILLLLFRRSFFYLYLNIWFGIYSWIVRSLPATSNPLQWFCCRSLNFLAVVLRFLYFTIYRSIYNQIFRHMRTCWTEVIMINLHCKFCLQIIHRRYRSLILRKYLYSFPSGFHWVFPSINGRSNLNLAIWIILHVKVCLDWYLLISLLFLLLYCMLLLLLLLLFL